MIQEEGEELKKIKHWLVTGDTHGQVMSRLSAIDPEKYPPTETAVIILGDAGINFYLNKTDAKNKKFICHTGFNIYCVRGNHEERPENLPAAELIFDEEVEGKVWCEPEFSNIKYFVDGEDYNIGGKVALVIGGAYSVDKFYRLGRAGISGPEDPNYFNPKKTGWFPTEQLTEAEMSNIEFNCNGNYYDVILTHTCPESWEPRDLFLSGLDQSSVDKTMEKWLDEFKKSIDWTVWLFGHYHDDRLVRPGVEMYFHDIEDWDTIMKRWENPENLDWWLRKDPNYDLGL